MVPLKFEQGDLSIDNMPPKGADRMVTLFVQVHP